MERWTALMMVLGVGAPAAAASAWEASVQMGAGVAGGGPAGVVRPRVAMSADRAALVLSAPMGWALTEREAQNQTWERPWRDPATYINVIELAHWGTIDGSWDIRLEALRQQTLGSGALVDGFLGALDPLRPRTGARLQLREREAQATLVSDSLTDPSLVASSFEAAPLAWLGADPSLRFWLGTTAAWDPRPVEGAGRIAGSGEVFSRWVVVRGETWALALRGAAAGTLRGAWGLHGGARWEAKTTATRWVLLAEAVRVGAGYRPGAYDALYTVSRLRSPELSAAGAQEDAPWLGRFRFEASGSRWQGGLWATTPQAQRLRGGAYVRYDAGRSRWQVLAAADDITRRRGWARSGYVAGETYYRLHRAWFSFASLHYGWRGVEQTEVQRVTEWLVGLGYGIGDRF